MRHQEEQRLGRRLLDQLEQGIGAGAVQVFGAVDDANPVAAGPGGALKQANGATDVVGADLRVEALALLVRLAAQQADVGVRQRGDLAGHPIALRHGEILRLPHLGGGKVGMSEDEAGETPGQRRFADPGWAAEDDRVRQPVAAIGVEQLALRLGVPEQRRRLPGVRRAVRAVGFVHCRGAHRSATASTPKRWLTASQIACSTSSGGWVASTTTHRSGSRAAIVRNACRSVW